MNIERVKAETENINYQTAAMLTLVKITDNLMNSLCPAVVMYLIHEIAVLKIIKTVPDEWEDRKEIQDFLLARLRKEIQQIEDEILQKRMNDDV